MEQIHGQETIKNLTDDELRRLANVAWYNESLELTFLCDQEILRRRRESEESADPD